METKYNNVVVDNKAVLSDIQRLINQIWKLIPMRENNENWKVQIEGVIIELIGLREIFPKDLDFLIILSKLEGLLSYESTFFKYRTEVFTIISMMGELKNGIK